jgi:hypothetical protein
MKLLCVLCEKPSELCGWQFTAEFATIHAEPAEDLKGDKNDIYKSIIATLHFSGFPEVWAGFLQTQPERR